MTIREHLDAILDIDFDTPYDKCKELIKEKYDENLSRSYYDKRRCVRRKSKKSKIKNKPNSTQKQSISDPPQETTGFIDDPNELLMSVAVRELNKPNPDPRWANILISCKKENITIIGDDIESFRKLPNEVLANLLNKSKQKT